MCTSKLLLWIYMYLYWQSYTLWQLPVKKSPRQNKLFKSICMWAQSRKPICWPDSALHITCLWFDPGLSRWGHDVDSKFLSIWHWNSCCHCHSSAISSFGRVTHFADKMSSQQNQLLSHVFPPTEKYSLPAPLANWEGPATRCHKRTGPDVWQQRSFGAHFFFYSQQLHSRQLHSEK